MTPEQFRANMESMEAWPEGTTDSEKKFRVLLATTYGITYGDDGELQNTKQQPWIDFKRDFIDEIAEKMARRAVASMAAYTNVADLRDPADPQGRSYRQVNAEKTHGVALGALVELESGVRLFVVKLGRDCDETPLYWLAPEMPEPTDEAEEPAYHRHTMTKWVGGYGEESLTVISVHPKDCEIPPRKD